MSVIATFKNSNEKELMILIHVPSVLVTFWYHKMEHRLDNRHRFTFLRLSIEFNNDLIPRCRKLMANVRAGNTHWIYCWRSIKTFHLRYCRFVLADYREKRLHYSNSTFEISFMHILNYCINVHISKCWFFWYIHFSGKSFKIYKFFSIQFVAKR